MYKRRRLKGVAGSLPSKLSMRQLAELLVKERHQTLYRRRLDVSGGRKK